MKGFFYKMCVSNKGQSTVEYVVVVSVLLIAFMTAPSVTKQLQTVFLNKSESYAFAVAISDPPSSQMDKKVHEVTDVIKGIADFFRNFTLPEELKEKYPALEIVEKFIKKIFKKD